MILVASCATGSSSDLASLLLEAVDEAGFLLVRDPFLAVDMGGFPLSNSKSYSTRLGISRGQKHSRRNGRLRKQVREEIEFEFRRRVPNHDRIRIRSAQQFVFDLEIVVNILSRCLPSRCRRWRLRIGSRFIGNGIGVNLANAWNRRRWLLRRCWRFGGGSRRAGHGGR